MLDVQMGFMGWCLSQLESPLHAHQGIGAYSNLRPNGHVGRQVGASVPKSTDRLSRETPKCSATVFALIL
ncbi:hypothetical protein [Gluconobacter frateurii]|uniref:hypothetical protein n=1 Tax=Gluconobacter frateurii TaxID=38308 RepID=UPI00157C8A16|nr:hypothetical protein [Gluconobacter frateurii]